jgi:cytidylate kinase
MNKIIIAIDGYSSCGKSTLAKQLAKKLNYIFIDSGAMYRAITFYFLRHNINIHSTDEVHHALQNISLQFKYNNSVDASEMYLNDENIEQPIRSMEVSNQVSEVAAIEAVREFSVQQQRKMAVQKGVVMDGRDIGTVVFPHAELKIFVTADVAVRLQRRLLELHEKKIKVNEEDVRKNLEKRDFIDTTRAISPLRKAADALVLDNTHLTREQQLQIALDWVHERT